MLSALQAPLFFGIIAASVTTLGLFVMTLQATWSARYAGLFGLAAAGMLVTMAFLHLLPQAFSLAENAPLWLTLGFFGGLILNYLVQTVFPERPDSELPSEAITPILAISIHSFIDGIVYSITFATSFSSGVYATGGLILHEFPEGIIAFAILRRHGVSAYRSFLWAFLAAAATTPFGVLVSGPFIYSFDIHIVGTLFAISAGLLMYVATGPLMAPLRETSPGKGLASLCAGVAIALSLSLVHLDDHADEKDEHHNHDHNLPSFLADDRHE